MLSLPNLLTLSRIFTVPILVALLWYPGWELGYGLGFGLYCLMGITDYFDGYLARAQGTVSKLGVFLDPIADKIMVAAVIVMLVGTRHEAASITGLHLIPALIILLRKLPCLACVNSLPNCACPCPCRSWPNGKRLCSLWRLGH